MAPGGKRSNGRWSTPATSDWISRTVRALVRKSAGNSRGNPMETTTSAFVHASSRSSAARSPRITGSNAPEAIRPTTLRRSASIGAVKRTRGIGVPDAAAGLGTLWALRVQALPEQLRGVAGLLLHLDVRLDGAAELVVRLHGRLDSCLL